MKIKSLILLTFCFSAVYYSQVGVNTTTPTAESVLDVRSTTGGLLIPRLSTTQRNTLGTNLTTAANTLNNGMQVYDTNTSSFWYWNGTTWIQNGINIYNANGTLSANRFVTQDAFNLTFNGTGNFIKNGGNVGIGTNNPNAPLQFNNVLANRKIVLNELVNNDHQFYGFGLSAATLRYHVGATNGNHVFFAATTGTTSNEIMRIQGNGNVGIGVSPATVKLHVVQDAVNSPVILGVNTNTTNATTSFGVRGVSNSTGLGSAGVSGISNNFGQNEIGVIGDYGLWGTGVFGLGWAANLTDMPTTRDFGVFGTVNYFTGTGVYGRNTSTSGTAFGVYCMGNFAVTGTKAASVPTSKGNQMLYCVESPEIWFEDIGGGQLQNGVTHIKLEDLFLETVHIDDSHPIRIFLQEEGESNGLLVLKDKDGKGFTVKEKNNGSSDVTFSYRIMAKRRFLQNQRFGVDINQPFENNLEKMVERPVHSSDPVIVKELVEKLTRDKEELARKGVK